jgi:IS30 family transposase
MGTPGRKPLADGLVSLIRLLRRSGWTYRDIAAQLGVHHKTVQNHVKGFAPRTSTSQLAAGERRLATPQRCRHCRARINVLPCRACRLRRGLRSQHLRQSAFQRQRGDFLSW